MSVTETWAIAVVIVLWAIGSVLIIRFTPPGSDDDETPEIR